MEWNIKDTQIQLALGGAATTFILYKLLKPRDHNLPPGPKGWPVLGNLLGMYFCMFDLHFSVSPFIECLSCQPYLLLITGNLPPHSFTP